jgi:hypothetical protein
MRVALLVVVAGAGLVYVAGAILGSASLVAQGGIASFLALAGCALVSGPAGRVRLLRSAAMLLIAAGVAVSAAAWPMAQNWIAHQRIVALCLLAAASCLLAAVLHQPALQPRGPGRGSPHNWWLPAFTAATGLLLLAVTLVPLSQLWRYSLAGVVPLVAALVALAVAVLAATRRYRRWAGAAGGLLLAIPALSVLDAVARAVPAQLLADRVRGGGNTAAPMLSAVVATSPTLDVTAGLVAAATVTGAALLATANAQPRSAAPPL